MSMHIMNLNMKKRNLVFNLKILFSLMILLTSCQSETQYADFVITNATIWTGNTNQAWAEAMAISGDTILAIGTNKEISIFIGKNTIEKNATGKFITPGFIDSHVHMLTGGFNLSLIQLRGAKSPEEFTQRIADYAQTIPKGSWILAGEWDHKNWGGELPDKKWIDEVTNENPVLVKRLDGHTALANSVALKLAGIDKNTEDVEGGEIGRNRDGEITGILKDNAIRLIEPFIPVPTDLEFQNALITAMNYVASNGVTSVHHMVGTTVDISDEINALEKAHREGKLIIRIYTTIHLTKWKELKNKIEQEGEGDKWLKFGGLKDFVDGSLGSHTAAFFEPYTDKPTDKGFYVASMDSIYKRIKAADKANLQVIIHAIGDKANNDLINTFEKVQNENGYRDRRFRIEHAQHLIPNDISRFSELGIIPSVQPYHVIDDGQWAEKLIGSERLKTTYAFKSLFDANAKVIFGSDWFVAPPSPLKGIYAAVTRRTLDGKNPDGWIPKQKVSVEQALIAYTKNAAFASFDEDIKGTLEPGKLADFVIISEDLTKIDPIRIKDLEILETYVGGKKIFPFDRD